MAPELHEWPVYWRRILHLWAELALAAGQSDTAFELVSAAPPGENVNEWPETLVRTAVAAGKRDEAGRLLTRLFQNPASYWVTADLTGPGFLRAAVRQAKLVGLSEISMPLRRFLDITDN
jgi:hypothetical protein